jgi:protein SCO1/2
VLRIVQCPLIDSMRYIATIAALFLLGRTLAAAQEHAARGLVLEVDRIHHRLVVSCDAVPGYMAAMDMPFVVPDAGQLDALKPGSLIRFTIVEHGSNPLAKNIQPVANFEPEPAQAGSLSVLNSAANPSSAKPPVAIGEAVPNFTLTDQAGHNVSLSQFRGKVVALTFGYSRCPNPNYCLRLSRNLAEVERQFHDRAGSDLVLLTIAIDPEYDKGPALARYARSFGADAKSWHFLTGTVPQVHQVAGMFGMDFWNTEGLLTHTLHTVIIDRQGRLAANIDGNQFTARQLGDLVKIVMDRPA